MSLRSKKILRCVILVCLAAVAAEALVRVYFAAKVGAVVLLYGMVDSPHDRLFDPKGVVLRWDEKYANTAIHDNVFNNYSKYFPNQKRIHPDEFGETIDATINSSGFRGRNFEQVKEPGVIRIVTLGASSTFGFKTRDNQTYPYLLEEVLNQASPLQNKANLPVFSDGGVRKFEVINLGIPHMQSDQIYSLFMAEAVPLKPDIVTFYAGYNDASSSGRDATVIQRIKSIPMVTKVFRELRHRLLSFAWFANKVFGRDYAPLDATLSGFEGEAQAKQDQFVKNIEAIYRECQRRQILLIVANQQAKSLIVDREEIQGVSYADEAALVRKKLAADGGVLGLEKNFLIHNDLMDAEQQWAKTNGVPFVDVIGAMDPDRQHLIDWMHLNEHGNQSVATALSDKILGLANEIPSADGSHPGEVRDEK